MLLRPGVVDEAAMLVVVFALPTVWPRPTEVDPLKLVSELYVAVMVWAPGVSVELLNDA